MSGLNENGRPSLYDYIAASMITIATVWLWSQASSRFLEGASIPLVTAASYGFYTLGGAAGSYLVLNKTGSRQISTGLKTGAFCFVASSFYFSLYTGTIQPYLVTAFLICFPLGGHLGALARIELDKRRIKASREDAEAKPGDGKGAS